MKFVCLGYIDEKKWESVSESEAHTMMDACFAYDDKLCENGHMAGGEALQGSGTAKTLSWKDDRVTVTDGPFAETREVLGGILILEARDMDHAVELMAKHPGVKVGPFEIRPAEDLSQMVSESRERRAAANT